MNVRYRVELSQAERDQLTDMLSGGKHAARKLKRAQILLAADSGVSGAVIATSVSVGEPTVYRTKRRFVEGNLELALSEEQQTQSRSSQRCGDSPPIIVQTVFSTVRAPVLADDVVEHLVIGLKWSRCCGDRSPDRPAPARCVPSATIGVTMWLECSVDRGSGPDRCPRHGGSTGNRLRHGQFCGPLATVPA
jgi:hypothetical protein